MKERSMKEDLEIIRKAMDRISVRGREDLELMGMCMDGLDVLIARLGAEKEKTNEDD